MPPLLDVDEAAKKCDRIVLQGDARSIESEA